MDPDVSATIRAGERSGETVDAGVPGRGHGVLQAPRLPGRSVARGVVRSFDAMESDPTVYGTMNGPTEFTVVGTIRDFDITDRLREIEVPGPARLRRARRGPPAPDGGDARAPAPRRAGASSRTRATCRTSRSPSASWRSCRTSWSAARRSAVCLRARRACCAALTAASREGRCASGGALAVASRIARSPARSRSFCDLRQAAVDVVTLSTDGRRSTPQPPRRVAEHARSQPQLARPRTTTRARPPPPPSLGDAVKRRAAPPARRGRPREQHGADSTAPRPRLLRCPSRPPCSPAPPAARRRRSGTGSARRAASGTR